jgi:hypothetical protein
MAAGAFGWALWRAGFAFDLTRHAERVVRVRAAQRAGDLDAEAEVNAELAREGFRAARDCVRAWSVLQDPETRLFPRGGQGRDALIWNGQDTGADLLPHLLYAAIRVAPEEEATWREVLAAERRLAANSLPRTIRLRPMTSIEESEEERVQNAAEFAADGLVPLVERLGAGPWLDRLREITAELITRAAVSTPHGPIPSVRAETNGNLLQVIARLYPLTRDPGTLAMAERIAAWYADLLPRNGFLPPRTWDAAHDAPIDDYVKLRDHGGEVVPGLAELWLMERAEGSAAANPMRAPLESMLGALIAVERADGGLWLDHIDPTTSKVRAGRSRRVVDTWGYLANAFVMAELAPAGNGSARGGRYHAEVERVMRAASRTTRFVWERGAPHDGLADAIESMLCLLPFHPIERAAEWIDDEIATLFAMQRRDGFVARQYLDGNFVRTAMLYAEWKTGGARLEPWRDDLGIGGAGRAAPVHELRLHLSAEKPWTGRLCLDGARHRTSWNLRLEYPRRNGSPEWFTVERGRSYAVRDLDSGDAAVHDGAALLEGVAITLVPGRARRLSIEPR